MKERNIVIKNKAGIHCRPSSAILTVIINEFPGNKVAIQSANGEAELTSMLSLLSLGLQCNDKAILKVDGPDEAAAIKKIGDLFEYEFDFPMPK